MKLGYDWRRNRMLGHALVVVDDEAAEALLKAGKVNVVDRVCHVEHARQQAHQ